MSDVWDPASNEILVRASELASSEQRAAYLDEACAGNSALRERVERLLRALHNAGSFLEGPADQLTHDRAESDDDPGQCIGTQIGPYEVLQQIGEGGFGVVYMAEQQRPVRRKVALKIIKPGMDSQQVIARFEAEQQALALMDHVNIARVLDAGTTDSGRPYFAMELVKGVPITEYCDKNNSSLPERLELFVTVCRAVQHAHQKGVIHRDIKPSNIMVTLHDGKPVPKVIDFGVAKAISQSLTEKKLFTHYGQMIGTPQYMSPEQAEMSGLEVDTRSDIYSLGVLLYEMLTATTPVTAEQLRAAGFGEIQRVIREEESPTPSTRLSTLGDRLTIIASHRQSDASKLSQLLRGELDWIVMKSLDKDRTRRYETASAFASDVEAYLHDEPVLARPPSVGYLLGKAIRKYRLFVATVAAIAIILVAATMISGWLAVRASLAEIRADQQRNLAIENANEARRLAKDASDKAKLLLASEKRLSETVKAKSDQLYASNMNVASQAYAEGNFELMRRKLDEHEPGRSKPDQQPGIEWYQLWQAGHLNKALIRNPHTGPFHYLAVSPDASKVAVSGYPSSVYIFDREKLVSLRSSIRLPTGNSNDSGKGETLCFSPDADFLVLATRKSPEVRVYETKNWQLVATLKAPNVLTVAFAKEKPVMATGSNGEIKLWDTSNWEELDSLSTVGNVSNMSFSADASKIIAMVGGVNEGHAKVDIWNIDKLNGQVSIQFAQTLFEDQNVRSIALTPSGGRFAVAGNDNTVRIWNSADLFDAETEPKPANTLTGTAPVGMLSFSTDEIRLVGKQDSDNKVVVWNVDSPDGRPFATIQGHGRTIWGVDFVEDAIWTSGDDGFVKVWDLSKSQPYYTVDNVSKESPVRYRDSETLVYLDVLGKLRSWNISTRKTKELDSEREYRHIALSDDGCIAAGIVNSGGLRVWNLAVDGQVETINMDGRDDLRTWGIAENGRYVHRFPLQGRNAIKLAVSNDGRLVACTLGQPGRFSHTYVFDVKTENSLGNASSAIWSASPVFSPSGNELVVPRWFSDQMPTSLFDVSPGQFQEKYSVLGWGPFYCAAFSTDGSLLATGGMSNAIYLHDVAMGGQQKQLLRGHTGELRSLTFAQDNSRLISGGLDGTVRIWKEGHHEDGRSDWRLVSTLKCNSSAINSVAVAPNGTSIAAVGDDDKMQVWRLATKETTRKSIDRQLARASDHIAENEFTDAIQELDEASERQPNSLDLIQCRALLFDKQGDWDLAIEQWDKAHALVPSNAFFLESRAKAFTQAGQITESTKDWQELVRLTKEMNAEYLLALSKNQALMGQALKAKANLLKVLKLDPSWESFPSILKVCRLGKSIVPTGTNWNYIRTFGAIPADWNTTAFDDSNWENGYAPFGTRQDSRTNWQVEPDIWLRTTFLIQEPIEKPLVFHVSVDYAAEIYLNGVLAAKVGKDDRTTVECSSEARLQRGKNILAVHCRKDETDRMIDVGLTVKADSSWMFTSLTESLKKLSGEKPYAALGKDFAMHRQWEEAAECFGELLESSPAAYKELDGLRAAVSNVYMGNLNRYDQIRGEMLTRYAETNNAAIAEKISKACLLTRPQESDMAAIDELIETSRTDPEAWQGIIKYAEANKTLLEYRRNENKEAIKWAQKFRRSFDKSPAPGEIIEPMFWFVTCLEALAKFRLGNQESAIKEIEDFKQFVRERSPIYTEAKYSKTYSITWHDWILCEILVREIDQEMPEKED